MATNLQRWNAICDALVNGAATDAQKLRLGRAVAARYGLIGQFDSGTDAQKLELSVQGIRRMALNLVRDFEGSEAAEAAHAAAANQADDDFGEG